MRFQSAFIAVTVLAASFGFADDILDESKAIEKIELLGGNVWRDKKLSARLRTRRVSAMGSVTLTRWLDQVAY